MSRQTGFFLDPTVGIDLATALKLVRSVIEKVEGYENGLRCSAGT